MRYAGYIGYNIADDDCMIVALFNVSRAYGKKTTYLEILNLALNKGWYVRGKGFKCKYLDEALTALKLKAKLLSDDTCLRGVFKSVISNNKVYMFCRQSDWDDIPGHVMVATKGKRGVRVHNAFLEHTGWKTLARSINSGKKHFMIEVTG